MAHREKNRTKKIWTKRSLKFGRSEKGAELLELALILPFLLVMVVGIIDFGEAWAMKDQLTGAARDGARTAVADFNDTTNPQCSGTPCSVRAAATAVVTALNNTNNPSLNTCGLDPSSDAPTSVGVFAWKYTATCANPLTIKIERAVPEVVDGTTALSTRVTVIYPYNWNFANVAGLLGGVNFFRDPINLSSVEVMSNLN